MAALWHWKHLASSVSFPGASGNPGACGFCCCANAARDTSNAPSRANRTLDERYKVVFTDALQHEEGRRTFSAIGDQVRAARLDRVCVAGPEPDLLLGIAQEEPEVSLQHVERVLDIVVIVPGHLLGLRKLDLGNAKAGPRRVLGTALDFVEMAAILDRFHGVLCLGWIFSRRACRSLSRPWPPSPSRAGSARRTPRACPARSRSRAQSACRALPAGSILSPGRDSPSAGRHPASRQARGSRPRRRNRTRRRRFPAGSAGQAWPRSAWRCRSPARGCARISRAGRRPTCRRTSPGLVRPRRH